VKHRSPPVAIAVKDQYVPAGHGEFLRSREWAVMADSGATIKIFSRWHCLG